MKPTIKIASTFEPLFQRDQRFYAFWGGRGSGKSHGVAQALVLLASVMPLRVLCCREIQKSIKDSVKRLLDDKIEASGLREFYQSTDTEVRGKNGSLFLFAGLRTNPESVKSTEGIDVAWVEEAQTVSQGSLDILTPTIRKPTSSIIFTWNPRFEKDPVDAMFRAGEPPPRSIVRRMNWDDNPWFPDVLRQDMEWDRRRDPDKYAHIWLGEYQRNSEARVFKNWRVEAFETPADARFYFGADWGFSVDPTTLVRCWIKDRTLYIDHEAHQVGCEVDQTPFLFGGCDDPQLQAMAQAAFAALSPAKKSAWKGIPGARQWPIRADSARPETISHMNRNGFKVEPANKGPNSVKDGIEFLKSYDIVIHPRCTHVADEFTLYSYETDRLTGEVLPVLQDKNNHMIDAIRYALELVRVPPIITRSRASIF